MTKNRKKASDDMGPEMAPAPREREDAAAPEGRFGVLVRGRVYYYKDKPFEKGVPRPVTEEEELYLSENAVDEVTVEGEAEVQKRAKFRFADSLDDLAVSGSPPARKRSR
jgi:hypothetical protein